MRRIADQYEAGGFNEAIQGLVRSSPWWMISLVIHFVIFLILWNVPFHVVTSSNAPTMQANKLEKVEEPEEEIEEPEPDIPEEQIVEEPIETERSRTTTRSTPTPSSRRPPARTA